MSGKRAWQADRLLIGLGNPGEQYAHTRHNAGFMVLDALTRYHALSLARYCCGAFCGRGEIEMVPVLLAKPWGYMNRSGIPVATLARHMKIEASELLVIHDDLDLDFGRIKITEKGGHGGHKGLKSIIDALGHGAFPRLRIGIGRPATDEQVDPAVYVLAVFGTAEQKQLPSILDRAREAVETVVTRGTKAGMNRFNSRRSAISN